MTPRARATTAVPISIAALDDGAKERGRCVRQFHEGQEKAYPRPSAMDTPLEGASYGKRI